MNNIERRDNGILYISDESVFEQQKRARRLTQKLNTMDRSDFEGISAVVKASTLKSARISSATTTARSSTWAK